MLFKIKVHLTSSGMTDWYINLTILWILILSKVLYSFIISSLTITQIQLAIKRLIGTGSPSLLCLLFIYFFYCAIMYWTLKLVLSDYNLQLHSVLPSALIMQLASPEKQVLLHWQCMNCIIFFTNILQPNVEKLGFEKVFCLLKCITMVF